MVTASTTKPSGIFTPAVTLQDSTGNAVLATVTVTATDGTWDLTKPAITSVTIAEDAAKINGKIDKATIVFDSSIRDSSITDANAALAAGGTTSGTFTTDIANDATTTFNRTTDDATTGTAAADGDFTYTGATTLITDLAGNLLDTATDGQIATADKTETDGANPVLASAVFNTSGGKETLTLTYSEVLSIYTGGDGATGNIAAGASATSTSTFGAMTTAKTLAGFGSWDGTMNFACNLATSNLVALDGTGKIVTITFNNTTGSFFTAGTIAPTTPTVTPVADTNDIKDAVGLAVSTATKAASTTAWDITVSTAVPAGFEKAGVNASGYDYYNWGAIANPATNDFGAYLILFSTTQSDVTNKTFASTTEWTAANDSTLATRTTATTAVTSITGTSATYVAIASVDSHGNVSAISNTLTVTPQQSGGVKTDTTGPDAPTEFAASVNSSLKTVLTWVDPIAADLGTVQIFKSATGSNYYMVGTVNKGVKTYTDNSVEAGDLVYYKLVGVDTKGNAGTETNVLSITVEETAAVEVENVDEEEAAAEAAEGEGEGEAAAEGEAAEGEGEGEEVVPETAEVVFEDIEGHWAETEIEAMTEVKVMYGKGDGSEFDPSDGLNRAEAAAMLYRVLGLGEPEAPEASQFTDVAVTAWYAGYVVGLKDLALVDGKTATTFAPGETMNRAEFLQMAMNVYYYLTDTELVATKVTTAFKDVSASSWYALVVTEAYEKGFVGGKTSTTFAPGDSITRAEAARILYTMFYDMLVALLAA